MIKILVISILLNIFIFADGDTIIKKSDYGDKWAFTVDKLHIGCESNLLFVVVKLGDLPYGLTGQSANAFGGRNINPIWRNDSKNNGLKVNISPFIKKAQSFCK